MFEFLTVIGTIVGALSLLLAYMQYRRTPKPQPKPEATYVPSVLICESVKMREPANLPGHWR